MPGLSTIIKKEISDAVSNKTFLFSLGVLVFILLFSGYSAAMQVQRYSLWGMYNTTGPYLTIIAYLTPNINLLGALVAVVYGFNSINKEMAEGSLKIVMSYPIFRDQVMLGKLLAGLIAVSIVTIASFAVSLAVFLLFSSILLTLDMIVRFSIFTLLTILFLSGWLGISMLLSQLFRDPKITLLVMFVIIGSLNSDLFSFIGQIISHLIYGSPYFLSNGVVEVNTQIVELSTFITHLSPSTSYQTVSFDIAFPFTTSVINNQIVYSPNELWNVFVNNVYSIGVLIIMPILSFVGNYVIFTRRDIS